MRSWTFMIIIWVAGAGSLSGVAGCSRDSCEEAFEKLRGCLTARSNCYGLDTYLEATCSVLQLNAEISYEEAIDTCRTLMPIFEEDAKICACEGETLSMAEQVNSCGTLNPDNCFTCE